MSLEPITVDLTVEDTACRYALEVEETSVAFDVDVDSAIVFDTHPFYEGSYTVNPGAENQTLQTAGKIMSENLTVRKIPRSYGLITWNGSFLTVS